MANNCHKNTEKNIIFGIHADFDCLTKNFGNVTTAETCVREGGTSDVVTCAPTSPTDKPSTLINVPIVVDEDKAKENSATSARVLQISQISTFITLCIVLLL